MNDRELLESAARAAGISGTYARVHQTYGDQWIDGIDTGSRGYWNPLANDGDALRLAVKLQLNVYNEHINAGATYCTRPIAGSGIEEDTFPEVRSGTNEDELIPEDYAATRRAIVLAAAEIWKKTDALLA